MASSLEVRDDLARVLRLDLIGPDPDHPLAAEVIEETAPSRFYLTGFLVPHESKEADDDDAELAEDGHAGSGDDEPPEEKTSARKAYFPSTLGLTVCVDAATNELEVIATWGDYAKTEKSWQRTPRAVTVRVPTQTKTHHFKEAPGVRLSVVVRTLSIESGLLGARTVSIFLVNDRSPNTTKEKDQFFLFQAALRVRCTNGFVARPNLRGLHSAQADNDERLASLQYRDAHEFAVGHGVSVRAITDHDVCKEVTTTWLPSTSVEKVVPAPLPGDFDMKRLAACASYDEVRAKLMPLIEAYGTWLGEQQQSAQGLTAKHREVADTMLATAGAVRRRILDGVELLKDAKALRAFCLANQAMEAQARQRAGQTTPIDTSSPTWRPFQLAFVLMNLRGIVDPTHADRETVDLLFFPTGGGKTEAYLGLAAFTLLYRRMTNPGISSAGVSVLMRYTLRLLTLDQLQRAATLVCALERIRAQHTDLGDWPFEIGLWVGRAATPNRMGKKGDRDENSARKRVLDYQSNSSRPLPIPIENCPWCGAAFAQTSFRLTPTPDAPSDLRISCANRGHCDFAGKDLPILTVDEPIYRRLPCFLIATLDKFAALPWEGRTGALFGKVDRCNADGFFGACDEDVKGKRLAAALPPPDLIIQDELHLISGPLGTIAGLYEAVIEHLASRRFAERTIRPKIVASTATVRRAPEQIRELFARSSSEVFPPPGIDRRDSFFAHTVPVHARAGRLYLGIGAPGRSLKVVLLRTYLALIGAAQRHYLAEGAEKNDQNNADPYMTLLGYFNSLRDLGGTRRIIEDEVLSRADSLTKWRRRGGEVSAADFANRIINRDVVELTSRESNALVSRAKRRLERGFHERSERVDVAIATNMISVGLDISRLGLMVVLGQPKTTAEYIQATSRVGRDDRRPGLVVTLLNMHKPRDRSHFERFETFHDTFYRSVEATSVTPFSPRAIDRALAGIVVGLARHGTGDFTAPCDAVLMGTRRAQASWVGQVLFDRALRAGHSQTEAGALRDRVGNLIDDWAGIAMSQSAVGAGLQYQSEQGNDPALLHTPLDPDLPALEKTWQRFKANRSLRDVEPSVNLFIRAPETNQLIEEE